MVTRRQFILHYVPAMGLGCYLQPSAASEATPLDVNDPKAKALAYTEDANQVDAAKHPRFKAGQDCEACQLYMPTGDSWGTCSLFEGKLVAAKGWCTAYQ